MIHLVLWQTLISKIVKINPAQHSEQPPWDENSDNQTQMDSQDTIIRDRS